MTGIMQHDYHIDPPKCGEDHKYLPTILRVDIDGFIKEAITLGWDYKNKGTDFRLNASNEIFLSWIHWEEPPIGWHQGRNYQKRSQETNPNLSEK